MKKYESIVIVDDRRAEEGGKKVIADIQAVIEELGGKFESEKSMGRKTFVKPIRKRTAGTYWNLEFELDEDQVAVLKERFRLNQAVLRQVVFVYDRPEVTVLPLKDKEAAQA
ncbi:MAG: 30S ribosomal protein S6 [Lentisphaeria bacterium]|nr:30S ribosomal protein S6 [Lentisphaeria bacterium]